MFEYTEGQIKKITESIFKRDVHVKPIGNHELKRHLVYHVTSADGLSAAFKIYYRKNRWNREVAALNILCGSNVLCPHILGYGTLEDGTEWIATEYIEGKSFEKVKDLIKREDMIEIYMDIGRELGKIHNKRIFKYFGNWDENGNSIDKIEEYITYFKGQVDIVLSDLFKQHLPDEELQKKCSLKLLDNLHVIRDVKEARLCHNDFNERNMLVKYSNGKWRLAAVLDFEQCIPSDRYKDLADIYEPLCIEDYEYGEAFREGYEEYMSIDDGFYKKKDIYRLFTGLWICSWAFKYAPDYYKTGIKLLERYVK